MMSVTAANNLRGLSKLERALFPCFFYLHTPLNLGFGVFVLAVLSIILSRKADCDDVS